jgi:hypothetical protein
VKVTNNLLGCCGVRMNSSPNIYILVPTKRKTTMRLVRVLPWKNVLLVAMVMELISVIADAALNGNNKLGERTFI